MVFKCFNPVENTLVNIPMLVDQLHILSQKTLLATSTSHQINFNNRTVKVNKPIIQKPSKTIKNHSISCFFTKKPFHTFAGAWSPRRPSRHWTVPNATPRTRRVTQPGKPRDIGIWHPGPGSHAIYRAIDIVKDVKPHDIL